MPERVGIGRRLRDTLDVRYEDLVRPGRKPGRAWLLDPRRLEILLAAAAYPGIHLRSASRLLLSPLPTLRYQVRILESRGILVTRRQRSRVHLFVPRMFPAKWERLLEAWQDPDGRKVIAFLRGGERLPSARLLESLGMSPRALTRTLSWLRSQGVVRQGRSQGEEWYRLSAGWVSFERGCRSGAEERLERFLAVLRADDLHPAIESIEGDRARITVDGRRSRIRFVLPLDPLG